MPFSNQQVSRVIRKSNELIEARYKLSVAEQRLIFLLLSQISPDDEDFKSYQIRVSDFARMFGLEGGKAIYREVEKAAESLVGQRLRLRDDKVTEVTTWLSYVKYEKGSGVVNLEFHSSLKPYLLQLKSHFTQYGQAYAIRLKDCQHSVRVYEILKMDAYKAKNGQFEKTVEVAELRLMLGIEKRDYPLFADFRKRAIDPAIKEISQKTDLDILDMRYVKTGRKVTGVTFVVAVRTEEETIEQQAKAGIEDKKPRKEEGEIHSVIASLVSLGFSEETAKACKTKHGVKKIERNIAYTLAKKEEGVIKSIPAYLSKAIEGDWGGAWEIEQTREKERRKQARLDEDKTREDEARKADEKKKETEALINDFFALPEEKRGALIVEFLGGLSGIIRKKQEGFFEALGENAVRENRSFRALFVGFIKNKQ